MASLTSCLKRSKLNVDDQAFIREAAAEYREEGQSPKDAALLAVAEAVNVAIADYNELTDIIAKQGVRLKHKEVYELPETVQEARSEAGRERAKEEQQEEQKQQQYQELKEKERLKKQEETGEPAPKPKVEEGKIGKTEVKVKKRRTIAEQNNAVSSWGNTIALTTVGLSDDVLIKRNSPQIPKIIRQLLDSPLPTAPEIPVSIITEAEVDAVETSAAPVVDALIQILDPADPWVSLLRNIKAANIGLDSIKTFRVPGAVIGEATGQYRVNPKTGTVLSPEDQLPMFIYDGPRRAIMLNEDIVNDVEINGRADRLVYILAHELVHSATYHRVHTDNNIAMELEALRKDTLAKVRAALNYNSDAEVISDYYGLTDVHEFMAEAFTNGEFQELLASIKASGQQGLTPTTSMWQRFIEFVKRALNSNIENTRLNEVLALGEEMLTPYEEIVADVEVERAAEWLGEFRSARDAEVNARMDEQIWHSVNAKLPGSGVLTSALGGNNPKMQEEAQGKFIDAVHRGKEFFLGFLTNDTIEREFGSQFEGRQAVTQQDGTIKRLNPLREYMRAKQREQAEAKKFERDGELLHNDWRALEAKYNKRGKQKTWDAFNDLIQEATMFEVHPDKTWQHPDNTITRESLRRKKSGKVAHQRLRIEYMKLPADIKQLYQTAKKFYSDTSERMRVQAITAIMDMYNLTDPRLRNILLKARKRSQLEAIKSDRDNWEKIVGMIAKLNENMVANGPYFPLNRFGDYAVQYEARETFSGYSSKEKAYEAAQKEAAQRPGLKRTPPIKGTNGWQFTIIEPGFSLFENPTEAENFRSDLKEKGFKVSSITRKMQMDMPSDSLPGQIMAIAERKMKGPGAERSKAVLREALINMLPDTSIRKRFLRRHNIAGASKNNRRAYAAYVQSAGWHLAAMKYRTEIDNSYAALVDAGKGKTDGSTTMLMSQVANEMVKRHNAGLKKPGKVGRTVAKLGFLNFLVTASYSMINATQPYTMTLPHLSGRYGMGPAMGAMNKSYRMVAGHIGRTIMDAKLGLAAWDRVSGEFDLNKATNQIIEALRAAEAAGDVSAGTADMLQRLADRGIVDATFALEISEAAKSDKRGPIDQLVEIGRVVPFAVEIMNRSTTAIAAYELELAKTNDQEKAYEAAREAVIMTQFDYTELNRPRYFVKNDLLRAMTMFKIHPLGVYSFIAHNVRKSLGKNATVDERRQAAKTLGVMMMTHGSLAGAAGTILMEPVRLALVMLSSVFGIEDDDEWIGWMNNPEIAMRQFLYEVTDSKAISEVVTHGIPRAAGFDVSTRIGLQNLMLQWTKGEHPVRDTVVNSIMGPIFGSANSFTRGFDYLANGGDTLRGLEYFMPKGVRDISRSIRYSQTGMTDWNGNVIQDPEQFSAAELAFRFIGFGTSTEAETYMGRSYLQQKKSRVTKQRKAFMNRYARAESRAEQRDIWKEIQEWNKELPPDMRRAFRLTRAQLVKSMQARRRLQRETEEGVRLRRKEREMRERVEFINP